MVDQQVVIEQAERLWRAELDRMPIASLAELGLTVEEAYAIQERNVARRVAQGAVVRGRRIGPAARLLAEGGGEPQAGVLLDEMLVEEDGLIPAGALLEPRVSAEPAFVLAADLSGPGLTAADAAVAIAGVLPAVEVLDSRIEGWRARTADLVADNAAAGRVVLGGSLFPTAGLDLRLLGVVLVRNGELIESAAGAAALGNPVKGVAWLANRLGAVGSGLRKGDVVLPGSLHRPVPARPGDVFRAEFARLGAVTVRFGTEPEAGS